MVYLIVALFADYHSVEPGYFFPLMPSAAFRLFLLFLRGLFVSQSDFCLFLLYAYDEPFPFQSRQDDHMYDIHRRIFVVYQALGLCNVHGRLLVVLGKRRKMASSLVPSKR